MLTEAEDLAEQASKRPKFRINLSELRDTVKTILLEIGRTGPFRDYTSHRIEHIDEMLKSVSWIIPDQTKGLMSPAEWFLIVCSIFLHDIGLLVTQAEYDSRDTSDFRAFVERRLYSGQTGLDYKERVQQILEPDRDRFLYEEFVRENHGRRARAWIEGKQDASFGASVITDEMQRVLASLDPMVRGDLALLVESHNLDDIKDTSRYYQKRPYANSSDDTANLQFCAIVLRTADLLQITEDRAPTTLLRIISPSNPVSQLEWVKMKAVTMVCSKVQINPEGIVDPAIPKDTIDVFATFDNQAGYFGLTALLDYAEKQIQTSHLIMENARQQNGVLHQFPWNRINRENIHTNGFLKKEFKFELDQTKILDLLTGHTLYNNGLVVVRELIQNALDAVRLYALDDRAPVEGFHGKIRVLWDERTRVLDVIDNGTGMSLDVIERHLLKVGSSKYQDSAFRKQHPNFHAISRFGIGVLSAFMVADSVEILTTENGDGEAREISLQSVHGRYLLRLLSKQQSAEACAVGQHGTRFRIRIRPSARTSGLLDAAKAWIVVPKCDVSFEEPGKPPVIIGHRSVSEALKARLEEYGYPNHDDPLSVKVVEKVHDGFSIAYALQWSHTFREWSLISVPAPRRAYQIQRPAASTCVHGIAVEFLSPGFRNLSLASVADATGPRAPTTNVARSLFEESDETEDYSNFAYECFASAVTDEVARLHSEENYTVTRATNEAVYLSASLATEDASTARYPERLKKVVQALPIYLVEGSAPGSKRAPFSLAELDSLNSFWTVEAEVVKSAENLLAQFKSGSTLCSTIETVSEGALKLPRPLLCNFSSLGRFQSTLFTHFQIGEVVAEVSERRIAFCWERLTDNSHWRDLNAASEGLAARDPRRDRSIRDNIMQRMSNIGGNRAVTLRVWTGRASLKVSGLQDYGAFRSYRSIFLLPNQPVCTFLDGLSSDDEGSWPSLLVYSLITTTMLQSERETRDAQELETAVDTNISRLSADLPNLRLTKLSEFKQALLSSELNLYDPSVWSLRSSSIDY